MKGLEKFNELTQAFSKLPGVGKKSAARFAYFVSLQDTFGGLKLAQCIEDAVRFIRRCERCGGLSENEICDICADASRDKSKILIVETPKDILDNYSRYAEQILGIEGLPAEFDINEIAVFNEALQNKLAPELSKICKKYGIKDNIGDITQNNLLQALPKIEIKNSQVIEHVSTEPDENITIKMKP